MLMMLVINREKEMTRDADEHKEFGRGFHYTGLTDVEANV